MKYGEKSFISLKSNFSCYSLLNLTIIHFPESFCYLNINLIFGKVGKIKWGFIAFLYILSMMIAGQQVDTSRQEVSDTAKRTGLPPAEKKVEVLEPDTSGKPADTLAEIHDLGVAVAPSRMLFTVKPGKSQTRTLTITNDTYKKYKFKIYPLDFVLDDEDKPVSLKEGHYSEFSLSRWIKILPQVIELRPGEVKKVQVTVDLPDIPEVYRSLWCQIIVDEVQEKQFLANEEPDPNKIVLGIIPSMAFIIWAYQNPPEVITNKVEILNFIFNQDTANKYVSVEVKNVGNGVAQCKAYIEAFNTKTGEKTAFPLRTFTLLPGQQKRYNLVLKGTLPPGPYTITCILDFGSKEEVQMAELDIVIPENK